MPSEAYRKIIGYEKVFGLYGDWPHFHDSEILKINLDRESDTDLQGPTVKIEIHTFKMTDEILSDRSFKCIDHAIITFKLDGVQEIEIEGFNHQNAIEGLSIEDIGGKTWENDLFRIILEPAFGVSSEIKCQRIEVESIRLGIPKNSVYEKN